MTGAAILLYLSFPVPCSLSPLFAQQPQAQGGQPIFAVNAKYVQGVGPGYWPTAGSGLTLNLAAGSTNCNNTTASYAGATLTMTASATNYVYLDLANSCAPASNTTGFTDSTVPIATVITASTTITSITDWRTWFGARQCFGDVCAAHLFSGADAAAKIANAIAALPSAGGTVDARGLTSAQTFGSNFFSGVAKQGVLLLGNATFTASATIAQPSYWMVVGAGRNNTVIQAAASFTGTVWQFVGTSSNFIDRAKLQDLTLNGGNTATKGIYFQYAERIYLQNVEVRQINGPGLHADTSCFDIYTIDAEIIDTGNATNPAINLTGASSTSTISDVWFRGLIGPSVPANQTPQYLIQSNGFVLNCRFEIKAEGRNSTSEAGINWAGYNSIFMGKMTAISGTQVVLVSGPDNRFLGMQVEPGNAATNGYDLTSAANRTEIIGGYVSNAAASPTGFGVRAQGGVSNVIISGLSISSFATGTTWGAAATGMLIAPSYTTVTTPLAGAGTPQVFDPNGLVMKNGNWLQWYDQSGNLTNVLRKDTSGNVILQENVSGGSIQLTVTGGATMTFNTNGPLLPTYTFAGLPSATNGTVVFCSDCNSTCTAGSSTGRTCFRENGAWTH